MTSSKERIQNILAEADIHINGSRPWDITIHNDKLYDRVLATGSLGAGEAYMDGWWDCPQLDTMLTKLFTLDIHKKFRSLALPALTARLFNLQNRRRAFEVGEKHYDIGNDLYKAMLDKRLTYTCAYWNGAHTLDKAQEAKLDLVCKKIGLKRGMRVLDIGCGWGSFCIYAAEKYGARVTGITVSREQADLAKKLASKLPVEILLQDYRDVTGTFDRVVSLGMFEHVGNKNYRDYFSVAHRVLAPDGLFLLHTIGNNTSVTGTDPWIHKYIFPNSMLPSIAQVGSAIEDLFIMEDWHNFGTDYDKTLMAWQTNFNKNWPALKHAYGERFYRIWTFYLLSSAAQFRARKTQLWQIVLSKGLPGGYRRVS